MRSKNETEYKIIIGNKYLLGTDIIIRPIFLDDNLKYCIL
jgi:hypothetical protein